MGWARRDPEASYGDCPSRLRTNVRQTALSTMSCPLGWTSRPENRTTRAVRASRIDDAGVAVDMHQGWEGPRGRRRSPIQRRPGATERQPGKNGAASPERAHRSGGGKTGVGATDRQLFEIRAAGTSPPARWQSGAASPGSDQGPRLAAHPLTSPAMFAVTARHVRLQEPRRRARAAVRRYSRRDRARRQLGQMVDAVDRGARAGIDEGLTASRTTTRRPTSMSGTGSH